MSSTTKGILAFFFYSLFLYGLIGFSQFNIDVSQWSVLARTILIVGEIGVIVLAVYIADQAEQNRYR